jgi:hypothetical protein
MAHLSNRLGGDRRTASINERAERGSGGAAINHDLGAGYIGRFV